MYPSQMHHILRSTGLDYDVDYVRGVALEMVGVRGGALRGGVGGFLIQHSRDSERNRDSRLVAPSGRERGRRLAFAAAACDKGTEAEATCAKKVEVVPAPEDHNFWLKCFRL